MNVLLYLPPGKSELSARSLSLIKSLAPLEKIIQLPSPPISDKEKHRSFLENIFRQHFELKPKKIFLPFTPTKNDVKHFCFAVIHKVQLFHYNSERSVMRNELEIKYSPNFSELKIVGSQNWQFGIYVNARIEQISAV